MKTWVISTLAELANVANEVSVDLLSGVKNKTQVLALHGDLGAGKTAFVQVLAQQLDIRDTVTSPTFVIMKSYQSVEKNLKLVHIDAYRLEDIDEMRVLGFEALLQQKQTIICIEWAERIATLLPADSKHLSFVVAGEVRTITYANE